MRAIEKRFLGDSDLAVTTNPKATELRNGEPVDVDRPSQIQLCDWFIDSLKGMQWRHAKDIVEKSRFQIAVAGKESKTYKDVGMSSLVKFLKVCVTNGSLFFRGIR